MCLFNLSFSLYFLYFLGLFSFSFLLCDATLAFHSIHIDLLFNVAIACPNSVLTWTNTTALTGSYRTKVAVSCASGYRFAPPFRVTQVYTCNTTTVSRTTTAWFPDPTSTFCEGSHVCVCVFVCLCECVSVDQWVSVCSLLLLTLLSSRFLRRWKCV